MSLVFAGIVPHSPITLPSLAAAKAAVLQHTSEALKEIEGELYVMQPEVLFLISPHAPMANESFSVNLAPQFSTNFEEFGDRTQFACHCDIELISKIREYADSGSGPAVNLINQPELDYATAVSAYHLTQHMPQAKLVPLSLSRLGIDEHYRFGQALRYVAMQSNKRIALIASAELAHTLNEHSPHQYHPAGATFDKAVIDIIQQGDLTQLQNLNLELAESAQAVNEFKALVVLSGALAELKTGSKILSYETGTGIGLLVAQFNLI